MVQLLSDLQRAWAEGGWAVLAGPGETPPALPDARALPPGPGVILGSGGTRGDSSGGRRWCLQPLAHLQASARATALWLERSGLEPARCLHLNPLPLHHVSGLLPRVRAEAWGCGHRAIDPALMRDPQALAAAVPVPEGCTGLISLVPTQLRRLLAVPVGVNWLRQLTVIWVGGAALPPDLAAEARALELPLAPCYGATETAAMVTVLAPAAFLAGAQGCGEPLADARLRLDSATGAVEVRAARLSPGFLEAGAVVPLPRTADGWWRSGDGGLLTPEGLVVLGRLDGALHSGGETVFPEVLEQRLLAAAQGAGLPLEAVLLLADDDPEWGQRLVGLVRPAAVAAGAAAPLLAALATLTRAWPPAERPRRWVLCPELACSAHGKWQRGHWRRWLASLEAG